MRFVKAEISGFGRFPSGEVNFGDKVLAIVGSNLAGIIDSARVVFLVDGDQGGEDRRAALITSEG